MKRFAIVALAAVCSTAYAQRPATVREPTYPIGRERVDTIHCPNDRKIEIYIAQRSGLVTDGRSPYVVGMKVDGKPVDASVIEPLLFGYHVLASDVTLAGCPDSSADIFSGEIVYWENYSDLTGWEDRVFIRFSAHSDRVTAERVSNIPLLDHAKRNPG